jgi:hypothetical protein
MRQVIGRVTCDGCGFIEETKPKIKSGTLYTDVPPTWTSVLVTKRKSDMSTETENHDMCPRCTDSYAAFLVALHNGEEEE